MIADLPCFVDIDEKRYPIRNNADYRVILDCIKALNDERLSKLGRIECALKVFYGGIPQNAEKALEKMFDVIKCGMEENENQNTQPLMDWEHDFNLIAPAISRILGYDIRTPNKYTHWWTLIGAYMEIPSESFFGTILSIRHKKTKGIKLEKWENEFFTTHYKLINIPSKLAKEDREYLFSD